MALPVSICGKGAIADRPTAAASREGTWYLQTDSTPGLYRCDGATWELIVETSVSTTEAIQDIVGALMVDSSDLDFTYTDGSDQLTATVKSNAITLAKLADIATARILGRTTAGSGDPEELTGTQATALLDDFVGDSGSGGTKGLVPAPGVGDGAANKVLYADGTWDVVSGVAPGGSAGGVLDGSYPNPGLASSVAGAGLSESGDVLSVNVDDSTIEIDTDTLRVKDAGITAAKLATAVRETTINVVIDGGGSAISTGIKLDLVVDFACTILGVTMLADQSGSIVVDIWKDTYANYPPDVADTITASAKPTISSATKSQDNTLTGWTTSIAAGDTLRFNVDSVTTITRVTLALKVRRT